MELFRRKVLNMNKSQSDQIESKQIFLEIKLGLHWVSISASWLRKRDSMKKEEGRINGDYEA